MNLKEYLELKEMTQAEFCRQVGVSPPVLSAYLRGKKSIGRKLAKKFSDATKGVVKVHEVMFP